MIRSYWPIYVLLLPILVTSITYAADTQSGFAPNMGAIELIQQAINEAQDSVEVAAYSFTSPKIANDLINAHNRGVNVRMVIDSKQPPHHYKAFQDVVAAGIPVRVDDHYAIMHNKYLVIDHTIIETGSFNYTAAAERRNAENVVVIKSDDALVQNYQDNWQKLWDESYDFK